MCHLPSAIRLGRAAHAPASARRKRHPTIATITTALSPASCSCLVHATEGRPVRKPSAVGVGRTMGGRPRAVTATLHAVRRLVPGYWDRRLPRILAQRKAAHYVRSRCGPPGAVPPFSGPGGHIESLEARLRSTLVGPSTTDVDIDGLRLRIERARSRVAAAALGSPEWDAAVALVGMVEETLRDEIARSAARRRGRPPASSRRRSAGPA
jgi:hypothetical protein